MMHYNRSTGKLLKTLEDVYNGGIIPQKINRLDTYLANHI